jgi:diaminopimelate decarboxylase
MHQEGLNAVTVSGNEIKLALQVGFKGSNIFFNGNGKKKWEIELAISNDCMINIDSVFDAENVSKIAQQKPEKIVQVLVRLNPALPVEVHPYLATGTATSKFGVGESDLVEALQILKKNPKIIIIGIHIHLGSTIKDISVFTHLHEYSKKVLARNHEHFMHVKIINVGGGLAVDYTHQSKFPKATDLAKAIPGEPEFQVMVEPGRSLVATSGVLLATVLGRKQNGGARFLVVDASMTDLLRPALYSAYHHIVPVQTDDRQASVQTVVGPVCESADFLAKEILMQDAEAGELVAVMDAGAYAASMANNYNLRGRALEVMVDGSTASVIANREIFEDLMNRFEIKEKEEEEKEEEEVVTETSEL